MRKSSTTIEHRETEESLTRIAQAVKNKRKADVNLALARLRFSELKAEALKAKEDLEKILEGETKDCPLFTVHHDVN